LREDAVIPFRLTRMATGATLRRPFGRRVCELVTQCWARIQPEQPLQLTVGGSVKAMIESDLALEIGAVKQYNDAVAIATKEGDNGSRDLLATLLKDEESHVDFLEAQMHLIKELGYERYLTQQMGDDEGE